MGRADRILNETKTSLSSLRQMEQEFKRLHVEDYFSVEAIIDRDPNRYVQFRDNESILIEWHGHASLARKREERSVKTVMSYLRPLKPFTLSRETEEAQILHLAESIWKKILDMRDTDGLL